MYVCVLKVKETNTIDTKYERPHTSSVLLFPPEVAGDKLLCVVLVTYVRLPHTSSCYTVDSKGHGSTLVLGHLYIFWVRWALKVYKLNKCLGNV